MTHDFEALRAKRNESVLKMLSEQAEKWGVPVESINTSFNPHACYCACTTGGPCEHKWDGEPWESDGLWTTTCSRCGCTAFSHSMRTAP
jgi:hypothetical protein